MKVRSYVNACYYLILSIIYEICATIFSAKHFKISKDRSGLTRSAVFLIFFIVLHDLGSEVVFWLLLATSSLPQRSSSTSSFWLNQGLYTTLGYVAFTE